MPHVDGAESMVVFFPEPHASGPMPDWHRHMTIYPWICAPPERVADFTRGQVAQLDPIVVSVIGEAILGQTHKVSVDVLGPSESLRGLHTLFHRQFADLLIDARDEQGARYLPHVTIKDHQQPLKVGDTLLMRSLSVVTWKAGERALHETISFGGNDEK